MKHKLKRLLTNPRALESRLTAAFEATANRVVGNDAGLAPPLELIELASDEIASYVHPSGRGRHAFPFNSVVVTFVAPTAEDQARLRAMCAGPPSLRDRFARRLVRAGCNAADLDVDVSVAFAAAADPSWARPYHLALAQVEAASRASHGPVMRVDLLVTQGTAERGAYTFTTLPIAIGRGADVRDARHQLLRINHVAFTEGDEDVNKSVSRRHARIELDPHTGRPRLIDDNSAQGTSVIRQGRGIAVPRGSRGLGLQTDDEIVLGQARMTVRIG